MTNDANKTRSKMEEIESLMVIGLFLAVFGLAVLAAIFFTATFHGKITNLICGGLLFISGAVAVLQSKSNRKKQ